MPGPGPGAGPGAGPSETYFMPLRARRAPNNYGDFVYNVFPYYCV